MVFVYTIYYSCSREGVSYTYVGFTLQKGRVPYELQLSICRISYLYPYFFCQLSRGADSYLREAGPVVQRNT